MSGGNFLCFVWLRKLIFLPFCRKLPIPIEDIILIRLAQVLFEDYVIELGFKLFCVYPSYDLIIKKQISASFDILNISLTKPFFCTPLINKNLSL